MTEMSRSKTRVPLTRRFIKTHAGEVSDEQLVCILALGASEADLEQALAWDMGESDIAPILKKPLAGKAEKIFDILNWDSPDPEEERPSQ